MLAYRAPFAALHHCCSDVRKAVYEVDDLDSSLQATAQSHLKRMFGSLTFAEALASQESINAQMRALFAQDFEKWGITVHRIELQDLKPKGNTASVMKQQMIAERTRRSEFIGAEGKRAAMRLKAEGAKVVKANTVSAVL
jgi:regulator of protease activity HflC (stomatin/prohibitin superfamily)